MIEVKNLNASFGKKIIFEDAGFKIDDNYESQDKILQKRVKGNFIALVGPNGSGKSTLLSLLDGIILNGLNFSGNITVDDTEVLQIPSEKKSLLKTKKNLQRQSCSEIAHKVSYLIQKENPVWNLFVKDFIKTGLYSFDELSEIEKNERVKSVLKLLDIEGLCEKKIFNISGGEFQKVRLARVLCADNKYLLLDEPSENLDIAFQSELFALLKKVSGVSNDSKISNDSDIIKNGGRENSTIKKTVIFSIHDLNLAANFADAFLLIENRKIKTLTLSELFTEKRIESVWRKKCRIYEHPLTKNPQVLFLE